MAVTAPGPCGSFAPDLGPLRRVPRRGAGLGTALSRRRLEELLVRLRGLRIAVVGDFYLDAYYDCDPGLDEASLETGNTCHQVVRTRRQPGAAGAVAANLAALGAGSVHAIGFCGEDGEGWELRRALEGLGLDMAGFLTAAERRTPTYGKICQVGRDGGRLVLRRELERLDIRNRRRTPPWVQEGLTGYLRAGPWDAVAVVDQSPDAGCGVVTAAMRSCLDDLAAAHPERVILVDSRQRLRRFPRLPVKPNRREAAAALGLPPAPSVRAAATQARQLAAGRRPVFLTLAERGLVTAAPEGPLHHVAGFPPPAGVPVDPVGAGDSITAALVCCLAAGASPVEAALAANLAGSVTVQQIGTTGTASPAQIRRRWREVDGGGRQSCPGRRESRG